MSHDKCWCKCDRIWSDDKPFWIICNCCDAILASRVMSAGPIEGICGGRATPLLRIEGYEDHECQKQHLRGSLFIVKGGDELETAEQLLIEALSGSLVGAS